MLKKIKKPVRSISGISVVAVMTRPYPCPHGRCIYCPGGVSSNTPQSYVDKSPVVLRAVRYNYDPYYQTRARLLQYIKMGHRPSKIEVIIMGGTFPAMPLDYQEWFVTQILEAMNRFPKDKPKRWIYLEDAQRRNEKAKIRCVGLTIETRPDWAKERHVDRFLVLGATRIEIGVQSVYDDVLKIVRRGHAVKDSVESTRILKDAGYKVVYHIMPGLPGSDYKRDLDMFRTLFKDPRFRPDMLKIYPTLVIPGTPLYVMWKKGEYKALSDEETIKLLLEIMKYIPSYVRIMRIQRDIPVQYVAAGPKIGNLRQVLFNIMKKKKIKCNEIRCREIGHYILRHRESPKKMEVKLKRLTYEASNGIEVFLSFEDIRNDLIIGFLRLRIPSEYAHRWEVDSKTAIIRELHIYGPEVPIGAVDESGWQHKGYGTKLLREAEKIALEKYDRRKILIISGIGVRDYYRKKGYRKMRNSFYMYRILR